MAVILVGVKEPLNINVTPETKFAPRFIYNLVLDVYFLCSRLLNVVYAVPATVSKNPPDMTIESTSLLPADVVDKLHIIAVQSNDFRACTVTS